MPMAQLLIFEDLFPASLPPETIFGVWKVCGHCGKVMSSQTPILALKPGMI